MLVWGLYDYLRRGGSVCPGRGSISPSVTCCRAMQPVWRHYRLAAGPERGGYVCHVDPRHGQDHRCGGETLYTSNECSSEVEQSKCRAPHPLLASAGGDPLRRLRKRAALAPSRETIQHAWAAILHLMALFDRPVASCRILLPCRGFPVQGSSIRERSTRTLGLCLIPRACGCALSARRVVDLECSACRTEHAGIPLC